ncbi:hypothetical protein niasHT_034283 [Heterodera trifolii]|uniref:Tyrosinase copper-binding domain-containing protein n=1 Tax=Heterodera trifolii TaxID=157864 RepID=A0ABD2HYX1_9BILA
MGKLRAKIQFDQTILFVLLLFFCITVYLRHAVATCIEESSSSGGTQHTTQPPLTVDYTVCKKMAPDLRQACVMRLQWWQEARKAEREGRIVPAKELPPPSQGLGLPTHRKATPTEKAAQPPPSVASERYGCLNTSCLCKYMKDQCVSSAKAATQLFEISRPKRQSGEPDKSLERCKRMEYRMLSDYQRERFHNAWLQMKNGYGSHEYDRLSFFHCNPSLIPSAHGGPTFLLWHREYLKRSVFLVFVASLSCSVLGLIADFVFDFEKSDPRISPCFSI